MLNRVYCLHYPMFMYLSHKMHARAKVIIIFVDPVSFSTVSNDGLNNSIDTLPPDKPHQHFSNQSEVWRTKVFHGYKPRVA